MVETDVFYAIANTGFNKDNNVLLVNVNKGSWTLRHNKADVFKNELKAENGIRM